MFVNEVGPPVGKYLPFIKTSLTEFRETFTLRNEASKFISKGKVQRKLKEPYNYPFKFKLLV